MSTLNTKLLIHSESMLISALQNGLDPFSFHNGNTWLFEALSNGWLKASRILLQKGVLPQTQSHGKPAFFALTYLQNPTIIDKAVSLLREYRTSLYHLDSHSNSILEEVSKQNHCTLLLRLLKESEYDFRDIRGATLVACEALSPDALKILLEDSRTDFKEGVSKQVKRIQFTNCWKYAQKKQDETKQREAVLTLLSYTHSLDKAETENFLPPKNNPSKGYVESCKLIDNPGHGYFTKRAFEKGWFPIPKPDYFQQIKITSWSQKKYLSQWLQSYDFTSHLPHVNRSKTFNPHEQEQLTRQYLRLFSEGQLSVIKRLSQKGVTPRKDLRKSFEYALDRQHYKLVYWMSKEGWISPDALESYLNNPRYAQAKIALERLHLQENMPKREPSLKMRL